MFVRQSLLILSIFLTACHSKAQPEQQTAVDSSKRVIQTQRDDKAKHVWIDKLNGRHYPLPDSIGEQPVSFYLDNSKVAAIAKAFYKGQFRPTDDDSTTQLLSYVTTKDSAIRPFYRWCLNFTIKISDGALGEYSGKPALQYAKQFPTEFFAYMDEDKSKQRYKQWTEIIAYSGIDNYDEKPGVIQKKITTQMLDNCNFCNDTIQNRIYKLAKDITESIKLLN